MFKKSQDIFDVIVNEVLDDMYDEHTLEALRLEKLDLEHEMWMRGFKTATLAIGGGLIIRHVVERQIIEYKKNKRETEGI